jgi:hypothetical protein
MSKNNLLILALVGLTMLNNMAHGAEVYLSISLEPVTQGWNWPTLQAYFVMALLDLSVISFIINGKTGEARWFAVLLFLINVIYWNTLQDLYLMEFSSPAWVTKVVAKIMVSATFAYYIHRFSRLYLELITTAQTESKASAELLEVKAELQHTKAELQQASVQIQELSADFVKYHELYHTAKIGLQELAQKQEAITSALTCVCGKEFTKETQLSAHKRHCKAYKDQKVPNDTVES